MLGFRVCVCVCARAHFTIMYHPLFFVVIRKQIRIEDHQKEFVSKLYINFATHMKSSGVGVVSFLSTPFLWVQKIDGRH